jgi:hypothetical protein
MPPSTASPVRPNGSTASVEVVLINGKIVIRDPNNPSGPVVAFATPVWRKFLRNVKKGEFDHIASARRRGRSEGRTVSSSKLSQEQFVPVNLLHFVHYHLTRATSNRTMQRLYLRIAKFARATLILMTGLMLVASLIFGAGVAAAVAGAGLSPLTAIGIGASGSATFLLTVGLTVRTPLLAVVKAVHRGLTESAPSPPAEGSAGSPAS